MAKIYILSAIIYYIKINNTKVLITLNANTNNIEKYIFNKVLIKNLKI